MTLSDSPCALSDRMLRALRQARDAGCDDLLDCAEADCGPLPFADLA